MRQAVLRLLAAAFLIGAVAATPASADPVTITGGQAVATLSSGSFSFTAGGLSASAGLPDGWSSAVTMTCSPCSPEQPVTLSFSSTCVSCLSEGSTGNELGGIIYPSPVTFYANFDFRGPSFSSGDLSSDNLSFTAPFTMTGSLAAFTAANDPNPPFYSTDLVGSGLATIAFTGPAGGLYNAQSITYDFTSPGPSPTPEPASIVLLGSGAALLWRKRRSRAEV